MSTPPPRAVEGGQAAKHRVHVTELQAALADVTARRGVYVPNTAVKGKLTKSFKLLDVLRQQQERAVRKEIRADKDWCPSTELVEQVTRVSSSAKTLSVELRALEELEIAAREGLSDEQLGRVVDHQLVRRANEMEPTQAWRFAAQRWNESVADVLEPEGRRKTKEMA